MFDIFVILGAVCIVYALYQKWRERDLVKRIERAGDDPNLIMRELDKTIREDRETVEELRRFSGKPRL